MYDDQVYSSYTPKRNVAKRSCRGDPYKKGSVGEIVLSPGIIGMEGGIRKLESDKTDQGTVVEGKDEDVHLS